MVMYIQMRKVHLRSIVGFVAVLVFGVVGTLILTFSHAATNTNSIEPETGTKTNGAVDGVDSSASDGHYISFAANSSTNTCPIFEVGTPPNCEYPQAGSIPAIASNFDSSQYLVSGGTIPASTANEPTGNFRLICGYSHLSYDDPIVYPGQSGASAHLHMFFGNSLTDANSTYQSLRTSGDGTCQGGPLNRTGYWFPAVFNQSNNVIVPDFISVYYKGENTLSQSVIHSVLELPAGLRMIAGYNLTAGADNSTRHFDWYCETTQVKQNTIPTCPAGERVGVHVAFPPCWDGHDLDSADHRSHLAYAAYVGHNFPECPVGFGVKQSDGTVAVNLPTIELGIWFTDAAADGPSSSWYLSSDRMPSMPVYPNGSTFHSDWLGAWDPAILTKWTNTCIHGMLNCQGGQLGDGTVLKQPFADPNNSFTGSKILTPPTRP